MARFLYFVIVAGLWSAASCASAQARPPAKPPAAATAQLGGPADKSAAAPAGPQINSAQISAQVNRDLGLNLNATIAGWQHELDQVEGELQQQKLRYSQLTLYRQQLQRIRSAVDDLAGRIRPRIEETKAQLNLLGPAPAAGQPPEPEQIALNRAQFNARLGQLSAGEMAVKSDDLRIDRLINKIENIRRSDFASILLQPIPGVYAYDTWAYLPDYVPLAAAELRSLVTRWWSGITDRTEIARTGLEAALLFIVLSFVGWRGVRRLRRWQDAAEPPFWRRASSAAGVVLLRAAPVAIPVSFSYAMIAATQPLPERIDWLFYLAAQSVVTVFSVGALVTTAFAPAAPRWRLIPASDTSAARICALVILLAFVYSLTTLLYVITRLVQAPFALTIAVALPSSLLLGALVIAILRTPLGETQQRPAVTRLLRALRLLVWCIVAAIVVCALTGYLPLARFLAQQLIVTGSILALVYLLLLWVDSFAQSVMDENTVLGRWLGERPSVTAVRRGQLVLPVGLALKFAVLVLSVPMIMLQWGYTWPDIREWYRELFFGLHIGNTQVTLGALLASIIVFGLGYGAARLFQSWLDAQVLQPAGLSGSVRHSIRTGVGYAGILVAALAAFSYAGFNLSSIAIVAGAFSIGIGFGLQNLVNNFVSGLILLAERPIRVGDLVVAGGEEGFVRKISVRATEIETLDRGNVLIPNSSFISDKVKNWTLRNNIRRLAIAVGTAYDCDPRQVRSVLLKVAKDHPDVLPSPAPFVDLSEFGASSLNFVLYVYINDISKTAIVRTDLSIAILDAFADAGIVIPFTQTDVNLRNADWLREALARFAAGPDVDGPIKNIGSPLAPRIAAVRE